MSLILLPLPSPVFGATVDYYRTWIETALCEVNYTIRNYGPSTCAFRQLSCLGSFLASALHRLDRVYSRRRGGGGGRGLGGVVAVRGSELELLLWRKTSWLSTQYHLVRENLYCLFDDDGPPEERPPSPPRGIPEYSG